MRVRREHGFSGFEVVVILALVALLVALAWVVHAATRRTEDMHRARQNVSTLSTVTVDDSAPPKRRKRRKTVPGQVAPTTSATTTIHATETGEDETPAPNPMVGEDTDDNGMPFDPSIFDDDDDRPAVPTPPAPAPEPAPQPGDEPGAEKDRP
jgi:hypothetical protein